MRSARDQRARLKKDGRFGECFGVKGFLAPTLECLYAPPISPGDACATFCEGFPIRVIGFFRKIILLGPLFLGGLCVLCERPVFRNSALYSASPACSARSFLNMAVPRMTLVAKDGRPERYSRRGAELAEKSADLVFQLREIILWIHSSFASFALVSRDLFSEALRLASRSMRPT